MMRSTFMSFSSRSVRTLAAGAVALVVCVTAGSSLLGCAGELPVKGQTTTTASGATTTSPTESQTVRLGKQVAATWEEAVQSVIPLLEGTPPAGSIQGQVAELKEQYVQEMVALGREIRSLPAADQRSIYDRAMDIVSSRGSADWFMKYKSLYEPYAALNDQASQDLAVVVASFDILTQYAFFDVLMGQEPDEAARLGVE